MVRFRAQFTMRTILLLPSLYSLCGVVKADEASSCKYPGSPRHGKLSAWTTDFPNASIAEFECYPGYELIGPKSLNCVHGEWNRGTPYCVRDIARGKPVVQSEPLTIDFSTELLVDGNDSTCTQPASRWSVDLFEKSRITTLKLVFGADVAANGVSIRVGDEPVPGDANLVGALCAKVDVKVERNSSYYVKCNQRMKPGSLVSVHLDSHNKPVPLCTLEAHTSSGVSHQDACPPGHKDTEKHAFNGACYEFHFMEAPSGDARSICYKTEGRLVGYTPLDEQTINYLKWRAEQIYRGSSFWVDINSTVAEALRKNTDWTSDTGKGACYVLNARNGFSRSECESPNHVICAYNVVSCGRPRLPKALDGWQVIDKLNTGRSLKYLSCSEGFYAEVEKPLSCDSRGQISGAVRCREFKCGSPPIIEDGFSRATSDYSVEYKCERGKFVEGDSRVSCDTSTLKWGKAPTCSTFFMVVKNWFRSGTDNFQTLPRTGQEAIKAAVAIAVAVALFGIFYRIHRSRQRKGIKGAFRLESRGGLPVAVDPNLSAH